jgi:diguanylate cyclase (GGDEF)-like protein
VQHRLNAQVQHLAHFDVLTALPARALFEDRLKQALARTADERKPCAVLSIDLDGIARINAEYGHDTGDRALRATANRLRASVRGTDTVARMNGDSFVVLLGDLRDAEDAMLVAEKLRALIGLPMSLPAATIVMGASIGVSVSSEHGQTPEEMCHQADQAMRRAKQEGRNRVSFALA